MYETLKAKKIQPKNKVRYLLICYDNENYHEFHNIYAANIGAYINASISYIRCYIIEVLSEVFNIYI